MDFQLPARPSMTRVSSSASIPLRHPTPDLQSLQGAYLSNVERLEQSAERLSMGGSDIGEELRKIREEQRRSESRKSSLNNVRNGGEASPLVTRQFSYSQTSNSIAGMNSIARSGGFSPEGYFASPRSSIRSGNWSRRNSTKARSASNGSRFAQMLESKIEAEPLPSENSDFPPIIPPPQSTDKILRVTNVDYPLMDSTEAPVADTTASMQPTPESIIDHPPRPSSADTYQQAQAAGLFSDFDGVHATDRQHATDPLDPQNDPNEYRPRQSSNRISSAGRPQSYLEPLPGENMIYYPAPVPMMLNLPQKLSKNPTAPKRNKRRSELLNGLAPDSRKSAAWLPEFLEGEHNMSMEEDQPLHLPKDRRKTVGDLPPQLRASLFFDYPALQQDVELKGGSAVETLDSILDASAFAPVSAFTDHPIAGRVGKEVYGRALNDRRASYMPQAEPEPQKRRSSINVLKKRTSTSNLLDDSQKQRQSSFLSLAFGKRKSSAQQLEQDTGDVDQQAETLPNEVIHARDDNDMSPEADDEDAEFFDAQSDLDGDRADEESELIGDYNAAPTTLLAELQLRKEQQKQRNRTAATAYPNGMHSTLLELDAVAQIQKQARTKKHTQLAWEDPNTPAPGAADEDDEDVPLGVLFPGRKPAANGRRGGGFDDDIPLGLIARRDMEDNEPLSHRRARLRGEPSIRRTPSPDRNNNIYTLDLPSLQNNSRIAAPDEDDVEGETLAQRLKRLRAKKDAANLNTTTTVSGDFASEIMSQFGGPLAEQEKRPPPPISNNDADPEEETLAQRRARLQAEKSRNVSGESNPVVVNKQRRRSMADLLQAHPAPTSRIPSNNSNNNEDQKSPLPSSATPKTPWTMQVQQRALSGEMTPALNGSQGVVYLGPNGNGAGGRHHQRGGVPNPLMFGGGKGDGGMGDVRNKDMIDRWRQSVL
ncbi:MAG: hypothetical protein Q9220_004708 [cf. Caloplaca sp. 1 TL-2023]